MPDKIISEFTAMIAACGTFIIALFGRSSLDKDIRALRKEKVSVDRFNDFKNSNDTDHKRILDLLEKLFDKVDK